MFERNDRALRTAHTLFKVCLWIFLIMCFICGIVCSIVFESGWYFLIALFGLLVCFLGWVVNMLVYSFLCDVKLIRNKLYGESNEGLYNFLKSYREQIAEQEEEEKRAELEEAKLALEELREKDMITDEEYEVQKKELLSKEEELLNGK